MKIALAQINPIIGDFAYNSRLLSERIRQAKQADCQLIVFPELALCGYPPQDLLERTAFLEAHDTALAELVRSVGDIGVVVGVAERRQGAGKPLYNSAFFIHQGEILYRVRKQLLPTYDVFDESRYFEPGAPARPFSFQGLDLALSVCEDIWRVSGQGQCGTYCRNPVAALVEEYGSLDILINISASPYHHGKLAEREQLFTSLCRKYTVPLLYVNQIGGQDALVFDGHSMAMNKRGEVCAVADGFQEDLLIVDSEALSDTSDNQSESRSDEGSCGESDEGSSGRGVRRSLPEDSIAQVEKGLVLGLTDYLGKTGFRQAVIGLSGGIDSAVTAVLASLALGAENVLCVAMPSPYTAQMSIDDARALAGNLSCGFEVLPIAPAMEAYSGMLAPLFAGQEEDVTEQNLQARIRGNLLMALSNKFGGMLLSTGNKSEMAVGYCTLYGDMSGGLAMLADVPKVMVYALARWMNRGREVIPERIISRPPTAELKPDQADQDDLPAYEVLDPILAAYLEEHLGIDEIAARGFEPEVVRDIIRRIRLNEHKRKQAPLGLKVTTKAFGYGRRYPIAHGFTS